MKNKLFTIAFLGLLAGGSYLSCGSSVDQNVDEEDVTTIFGDSSEDLTKSIPEVVEADTDFDLDSISKQIEEGDYSGIDTILDKIGADKLAMLKSLIAPEGKVDQDLLKSVCSDCSFIQSDLGDGVISYIVAALQKRFDDLEVCSSEEAAPVA